MKLISERSVEPVKELSMKIPSILPGAAVPGLQETFVHVKSVAKILFSARNVKDVPLLVMEISKLAIGEKSSHSVPGLTSAKTVLKGNITYPLQ